MRDILNVGIKWLPRTQELLGLPTGSIEQFIPALRAGFPWRTVASLSKNLALPAGALWQTLGLSARTLARRRAHRARLTLGESERVLRLAIVLAAAIEALGSIEKARHWLQKRSMALGDLPLRMLDTDIGTSLVLDELGRIVHGVVA